MSSKNSIKIKTKTKLLQEFRLYRKWKKTKVMIVSTGETTSAAYWDVSPSPFIRLMMNGT